MWFVNQFWLHVMEFWRTMFQFRWFFFLVQCTYFEETTFCFLLSILGWEYAKASFVSINIFHFCIQFLFPYSAPLSQLWIFHIFLHLSPSFLFLFFFSFILFYFSSIFPPFFLHFSSLFWFPFFILSCFLSFFFAPFSGFLGATNSF